MASASCDYVTFGRSGLRISPFLFGGGGLGTTLVGDAADTLLDRYIELGGNVIDTAVIYGYGKSEEYIGDYMKRRGNRQRLIVGTKYSPNMEAGDANAGGNGRKNMMRSIDQSLARLGTDWIDLYWLHAWDCVTPAEEVVEGMNMLIRAGKALHYGLSNVPAWYAARVCAIADQKGLERPIAMQLSYALVERNIEREHVPLAQEMGMGICTYSVLADGFLSGKYRRVGDSWEGEGKLDRQRKADFPYIRQISEHDWAVLDTLNQVASEMGEPAARVALNWVATQPGITAPLLGATRIEQLDGHVEALRLTIPAELRERLDAVSKPPILYPYNYFEPSFQALMEAGIGTRKWRPAA